MIDEAWVLCDTAKAISSDQLLEDLQSKNQILKQYQTLGFWLFKTHLNDNCVQKRDRICSELNIHISRLARATTKEKYVGKGATRNRMAAHLEDIPTRARMQLRQTIKRYNNNLISFTSAWIQYVLPITTSSALATLIGWSAESQIIVSFALCCGFVSCYLIFAHFYPYPDTPEYILENPTLAAFFGSFHREEVKDLKFLDETNDIWTTLKSRHEERQRQYTTDGRPNSSLVYAMIIDGIEMLFYHQ